MLSDIAELGESLAEALEKAIRSADVVVAVLEGDQEAASNTAFEVGLAAGIGKPVLVVASGDAPVPGDLNAFLQVRPGQEDDVSAIAFALDHLERFREGPTHARRKQTGVPLGTYADTLLSEIAVPREPSGREVEELLSRAIEASGPVTVVSGSQDPGFDIGVWSDDLDAIAGNPLLVEVKLNLDRRSVQQCLSALHRTSGARAALIVFTGRANEAALQEARWPLLAISLEGLLGAMRERSFAETVRDLRNRSVHGAAP